MGPNDRLGAAAAWGGWARWPDIFEDAQYTHRGTISREALGEHSDEVLREVLGRTEDEIATLRADGVV